MIKANIFKIILDTNRTAFNAAIIERNNNTYALVIDKSIKRYKTYQNLFFRLVDGLYKIDYVRENDLRTSTNPDIKTKRINNKNLFDNFEDYKNSTTLNIETKYFELVNNPDIHLVKNKEFYDLFGSSVNDLLVIDYSKNNLLDKNLKLIAPFYDMTHKLQDFVETIIIQDYSKGTLEIESKYRFDFDSLNIGALNILGSIKRYAKELFGEDAIDERVSFGLVNKCIQTTFYIPKNDLLTSNSTSTTQKLDEISHSNILIKDETKLNIASIVNDVFKDDNIESLKFSFQEEIDSNKVQEVNIYKNSFDKLKLKTSIKEYKNKQNFESLTTTFLIDDVKGVQKISTTYHFIDKVTNIKYKKVFKNNCNNADKIAKAKLLLLPQNSEIKVEIKYNKISKDHDIESIKLL